MKGLGVVRLLRLVERAGGLITITVSGDLQVEWLRLRPPSCDLLLKTLREHQHQLVDVCLLTEAHLDSLRDLVFKPVRAKIR